MFENVLSASVSDVTYESAVTFHTEELSSETLTLPVFSLSAAPVNADDDLSESETLLISSHTISPFRVCFCALNSSFPPFLPGVPQLFVLLPEALTSTPDEKSSFVFLRFITASVLVI